MRDPAGVVAPDAAAVERFRSALDALCKAGRSGGVKARLGLAVSGGPDSLALLLLAHAAFVGRVEAATVDHGLRPEAAAEAAMVAEVCERIGVPHAILREGWSGRGRQGLQAAARAHRYRLLGRWCCDRELPLLLTAHHADDQAETLLMRLARGAGVRGLSAIRPARALQAADVGTTPEAGPPILLLRPLLSFAKAELRGIVAAARLPAVEDPSNADPRYDRTQARRLLADAPWISAVRLSAAARHMAAAEDALDWMAEREYRARVRLPDPGQGAQQWLLDPADLPDEILRRIVLRLWLAVARHTPADGDDPITTGPKLTRFIGRLNAGEAAMLGDVLAHPGRPWRFEIAPPRRRP